MRRAASVFANDSLLLLTAVIWGMAFVAQRLGMEHVGPFTYNAVRFALGIASSCCPSSPSAAPLRRRAGVAGTPRLAAAARTQWHVGPFRPA